MLSEGNFQELGVALSLAVDKELTRKFPFKLVSKAPTLGKPKHPQFFEGGSQEKGESLQRLVFLPVCYLS